MIKTLAAFALAASPAMAQDITLKQKDIPKGSWVLYDNSGTTQLAIFYGKSGGSYKIAHHQGKSSTDPLLFQEELDDTGNLTALIPAKGLKTTYAPHNCQRTPGECHFIQSTGEAKGQMVRTTELKGKGFTFTQVLATPGFPPIHIQSGTITALDLFGQIVKATTKAGPDKTTGTLTKIKASWD